MEQEAFLVYLSGSRNSGSLLSLPVDTILSGRGRSVLLLFSMWPPLTPWMEVFITAQVRKQIPTPYLAFSDAILVGVLRPIITAR